MLIDTHAHIYSEQFANDIDEVIGRSRQAGLTKIFMPNVDSESIEAMLAVEEKFKGYCFSMMGLHPCSVKEDFEKELEIVETWLSRRRFSAVGEIGTDLYWDKTYFDQQKAAFNFQMDLAIQHRLPVVIHCRESIDETLELVERKQNSELRGVFHCFTGSVEQAERVTDLGFYLGIGGVATFKNGGLTEVIQKVDLHSILLETDSPYLAPVPYRGKRNEPAYVKQVADRIAEIKGIGLQEVAERTTANALKLYEILPK